MSFKKPSPASDTVYVSYIAATPEKIWTALTGAEFTRQYFFGLQIESDWRVGSVVKYFRPDGVLDISGKIIRCDPPRALAYTWHIESDPLTAKLPDSIVTFELEPLGAVVRLTLIEAHPDLPDERLLEGGRRGWPAILSGLKTLMESGQSLPPFDMTYLQQGGVEMRRVIEELKL
ncbi:MAG TPA: SRPBCC family protein [Opitutaceae bacterium]|nr:SRPBCC family protein [Opitutaceae bacterium]